MWSSIGMVFDYIKLTNDSNKATYTNISTVYNTNITYRNINPIISQKYKVETYLIAELQLK